MNIYSFRGADKILRYLSNIEATLTENKKSDETINVNEIRKKIKNAIQETADMDSGIDKIYEKEDMV